MSTELVVSGKGKRPSDNESNDESADYQLDPRQVAPYEYQTPGRLNGVDSVPFFDGNQSGFPQSWSQSATNINYYNFSINVAPLAGAPRSYSLDQCLPQYNPQATAQHSYQPGHVPHMRSNKDRGHLDYGSSPETSSQNPIQTSGDYTTVPSQLINRSTDANYPILSSSREASPDPDYEYEYEDNDASPGRHYRREPEETPQDERYEPKVRTKGKNSDQARTYDRANSRARKLTSDFSALEVDSGSSRARSLSSHGDKESQDTSQQQQDQETGFERTVEIWQDDQPGFVTNRTLLLDTQCKKSNWVSWELIEDLELTQHIEYLPKAQVQEFTCANKTKMLASEVISLSFRETGGVARTAKFYVASEEAPFEIMLGADDIIRFKMLLSNPPATRTIFQNKSAVPRMLTKDKKKEEARLKAEHISSTEERERKRKKRQKEKEKEKEKEQREMDKQQQDKRQGKGKSSSQRSEGREGYR